MCVKKMTMEICVPLKRRLSFDVYKRVPKKVCPLETKVYEKMKWKTPTGRIGIYQRTRFGKSEFPDCYAVFYRLIKII